METPSSFGTESSPCHKLKFSVVTISFNQGRFLESCLKSVLDQNYPRLEYIVVDPGSTDRSRRIIERYADRISRVIFEQDLGPADGLNKGFRHATGDIFCYLNADDVFLPDAFERVARHFEKRPDMDVLCGNGFQIDEDGRRVKRIFSTRWGLRRYAHGACNVVQQATFFRGESFRMARGFNIGNRTCWDGELLVDMALAGARFGRTSKFCGAFRLYGDSITGSGRLSDQYRADSERVMRKALGRTSAHYDAPLGIFFRIEKIIGHPRQNLSKVLDRLSR